MVSYTFTKNVDSFSFGFYTEKFDISSYKKEIDDSKTFEPESNTVYSFQTLAYSSDEYGPSGNIVYNTGNKKDEINFSHVIVYNDNVYLLPEVFFLTQDGQKEYAEKLDMWNFVEKAKDMLNEGQKLYHIECIWPGTTNKVTMSQTVYIENDESVKRLHNGEVVNIDSSKLKEIVIPKFVEESLIAKFIQYISSK